ncbi:M16 family metallopeptidase [Senegalia massiliensis]|uniref:Insulinase family protein n=1 Tax=Senegalia massiliensis TaxID=1720316 RepID=A0A845R012_9CLOT|nr:pitrilysin family protein [Senegalia massiliensis]NBI07911.1 insulinase family protein [Senegalia massiliensis]
MYNKTKLSNGIRIITENIPYVNSISIGLWVESGSRYENKDNNGVSHFIEHILFKGTKNRTARDIAEQIDSVGGQMNAFTSKECTCFYIKILDNHIDLAIDILQDMLFNSTFDENEIDKEKNVIIEEINMYEDAPEEIVHDLLSNTVFKKHPLSLPILGNKESINNLTKESMVDYFKKYYIPENIVISIVGNIDEENILKTLEKNFGVWKSNKKKLANKFVSPTIKRNIIYKDKDTEQLHLCLGLEGLKQSSKNIYSLLVLNNIFGGSMSSRLFQKVREDLGIAYSIYSYPSTYKDTGIFTIYAGLNPKHLIDLSKIIINEIKEIKANIFSEEEIFKSKEQLKGNFILGLENTSSRMSSYGKSELLNNKIETPNEIINSINKVNKNSIREVIDNIFNIDNINIAYVGRLNNKNIESDLINIYKK